MKAEGTKPRHEIDREPSRRRRRLFTVCLALCALCLLLTGSSCRRHSAGGAFVLVLEANPDPRALNPLLASDAASERFRQLMFNSLMKKNERFEYVPELVSDYKVAPDGLSVAFTLRDNVKFHNGKPLTSADVKYTFEKMIASGSTKSASYFEGAGDARQPFINGFDTPDARTVVFRLRKPWLDLFSNLIPIGILPEGSFETQEKQPVGTGPYKFVSGNSAQQFTDFAAFDEYWEGAPAIKNLRVRVILDAGTQQAGLQSGEVDLAVNTALTPDTYVNLGRGSNLQVVQSPGANVQYLNMNTENAPLDDARVRRAIAYSIDRESIIKNLLSDQARIAHSMLPPESWAYSAGKVYTHDPAQAKKLLDEAGFRDPDGDGARMRFGKPLVFKISATNAVGRQTAGIIQNELTSVGIPVQIETLEDNTMRDQVKKGQYHMTTGRWVGGNQDPIFLRDLFTFLLGKGNYQFNRSRYSNPALDKVIAEAVSTTDRERARQLYTEAQNIISEDVPTLPLWYWNNIVVAKKSVGNITVPPSGDWTFVRNLTVTR
ncbi:MAG: ABC transporter substrate-binding protein [Acidobacteria bacterium]|nr:ABC transporter substrate-binding protein [Acidobacteriota bacterium]MCA1642781.1 ABC transporter substrate-binding protein [Acidobacteriota bacterium]